MSALAKFRPIAKFQLAALWLYFFAAYLPFFFFMARRHDVGSTSMSAIGWITGGLFYLSLYLAVTLPYCLCLLLFFNRHFNGGNKKIKSASFIAGFLMTGGAFIPLRGHEGEDWVSFAHTFISVSGTVMLMLTILFSLGMRAARKKSAAKIISLCAVYAYAFALMAAFLILRTAALFQLAAGASFFLTLLAASSIGFQKKRVDLPLV